MGDLFKEDICISITELLFNNIYSLHCWDLLTFIISLRLKDWCFIQCFILFKISMWEFRKLCGKPTIICPNVNMLDDLWKSFLYMVYTSHVYLYANLKYGEKLGTNLKIIYCDFCRAWNKRRHQQVFAVVPFLFDVMLFQIFLFAVVPF